MTASCWNHNRFRWWRQAIDGNCAWLRAAIEADAASGAVFTGVVRGMNAVCAQLRQQNQAFRRAGLHAQPASFAFIHVYGNIPACLRWHNLPRSNWFLRLGALQPLCLFAVLIELVAKLGMSDLDQRFGPLTDALTVQVR